MAVLPVQYELRRIERLAVGWVVVVQWLKHWWPKLVTWV